MLDMLFSCNVVSPKSVTFSIQKFWYSFGGGALSRSPRLFLWTVLPLCNLVSCMMKANLMIHLLLQMSEEREVAEGRLRTLGTLTVRLWELLCLIRPCQSPAATSTRSLHYLLWGGETCCHPLPHAKGNLSMNFCCVFISLTRAR